MLIGQTALATGDFRLDDLPSTSGRIDALLRCLRAAFLTSHGLRAGVEVYLVLRGGAVGPRTLRVTSERVKFLRPDERSLAILVQKTLRSAPLDLAADFIELRPGLDLRSGDLEQLLDEARESPCFVLEEGASDLRGLLPPSDAWFFIGDPAGFEPGTRALLRERGCRPVSVGPLSLHAEDVVTLIGNELDRAVSANGARSSS